jgi:hypothetical protein
MSMGLEYVSELQPPKGLLFIRQKMYEREDTATILAGKIEEIGENLSQCHFVDQKSHMH